MCRSKINITIAFEHANVLEIQDISCKRWANFRDFEPHLTPRVPPKKDCSILLNVRRNRISHEILSTRANLQLLWVIISGIVNFWPFWTPIWCPECPKNGQSLWFVFNEGHYESSGEKLFLCAYLLLLGLLLEKWTIFDPFWPLGCPKNGTKLMICPKWVAV